MSDAKCALCGEPMPAGEEMFKYHGYSGNCPKPPLPKEQKKSYEELERALTAANAKLAAYESVEVPEEPADVAMARVHSVYATNELIAYIDTLLRAYRSQAVRLKEAERDAGEKPCCHEWYHGSCAHCDKSVNEYRAEKAALAQGRKGGGE